MPNDQGEPVTPADDEEVTRDTPIKINLPFAEAVRRLLRPRDQATNDDASGSEDDSR